MSKHPAIAIVLACCTSGLAAGAEEAAGPGGGKRPVKIYVVTDLEGASGVYQFAQSREADTPLNLKAKEYFMGDLAAVVRGLREGGADEVLVLDGHGSGALVPHLMAPGAKYITGKPRPGRLTGLDDSFAGLVLLACHAMNGTADGVLHHTQSSKSESRYWYNGVESGELAQCAAIAGHYGVAPILVTGDVATCREARQFFGQTCVTVAVKEGLSREAAILYPFAATREALYVGARNAMRQRQQCQPYRVELPIHAKRQWLTDDEPRKLLTKEATLDSPLDVTSF